MPFGNKAWRLGTRPRSVVSAGLDFNSVRLVEETESRVKGSILRQFDNYHGDAGSSAVPPLSRSKR